VYPVRDTPCPPDIEAGKLADLTVLGWVLWFSETRSTSLALRIFGSGFTEQVEEFGIEEVLGAPGVPQQRAYGERVIGTIRRECLDHVIVFNEVSLCRHRKSFREYDHGTRTHLSLEKDTPERRSVEPPESGRVVAVPQVGGLPHRYERRAA
jgi:hypothetical protein